MMSCTEFYEIQSGDTLYAIANKFNTTTDNLLTLNPTVDPLNLRFGDRICVYTAPPKVEIVINVADKRLTVYIDGKIYRQYIVATGAPDTPTPIGNFEIINKQIDPGGPYGTRWLGLSKIGYGIHGTNDPASIGTAVSNGCIRMYNEDIERLFEITNVGTPVRIQP